MAMITSLMSGPMMEMLLRRRQRLRLTDFFSEKQYIPDLRAHDMRGAITELAGLAAQVSGDALPRRSLEAVWRREKQLMHTGLGDGVAVPHARIAAVQKPIIIFARSRHGVDFDAHDGRPAHIVMLILTPAKGTERGKLRSSS